MTNVLWYAGVTEQPSLEDEIHSQGYFGIQIPVSRQQFVHFRFVGTCAYRQSCYLNCTSAMMSHLGDEPSRGTIPDQDEIVLQYYMSSFQNFNTGPNRPHVRYQTMTRFLQKQHQRGMPWPIEQDRQTNCSSARASPAQN